MKKLLLLTTLLVSPALCAATQDAAVDVNQEAAYYLHSEVVFQMLEKHTGENLDATAAEINTYLTNNNVHKLLFSQKFMDSQPIVEIIAKVLGMNATLTSLKLMYNEIGDAGAQYLANALLSNSTLTSLELIDCGIGDVGAQYLATALQPKTTLTSLDLCGNKIGMEGARCLANALISNSKLTSFSLKGNKIGDEGVRHLANALISNSTLKSLNLEESGIHDEGVRHLEEALLSNSTLISLNLGFNSIDLNLRMKFRDNIRTIKIHNQRVREANLQSMLLAALS